MSSTQIERMECALLAFIERATEKEATAAEMEALPAVAVALIELHKV